MAREATLRVPVTASQSVSAILTTAAGPADAAWCLVYAPGAGSNLRDPFGVFAAQALADAGIDTLRFQFPYMEAGRRLPDRPPILEATWTVAINAGRQQGRRLVVGGRSMGGRIASQVVARGIPVEALVLFAYPLHPPGRPSERREGHLRHIAVPTLFCSGTRDAFGTPDELREVASLMGATLYLLEGADHSFGVRKDSGRTREKVWDEALTALLGWLGTLME